MNGGDVRMVQRREDLHFSLEPGEAIRVAGERLGQDLQCHATIELGIGGTIHLLHAAFANEDGHVVVPETGADVEDHNAFYLSASSA